MAFRDPRAMRRWLIAGATAASVLAVAFAAVGLAAATDRSDFCDSCHEMRPFHAAWSKGPHSGVACVDCHVDRGLVSHLKHKVVAAGQVRMHVFGRPTFPLTTAPEVPNERCVSCHREVPTDRPGFSHDRHAQTGPCQSCHAETGHAVSAQALAAAGVLDETAFRTRASTRTARMGQGAANLAGHVPTDCESCHDMKATPCKSCHEPDHEPGSATKGSDCGVCHAPGASFVFAHPSSPACTECHTKPATHSDAACARCHSKPGLTWAFDHGTAAGSADCGDCHARPTGHGAGTCSTCHTSGASWAFTHPKSGQCATCHKAPADHRTGECASCHPRAGADWAFKHPSAKTCTTCHRAPARHSSGSCTSCHRIGSSWAFRHPASSSCAACHKAPAGHYPGTCSSCHSPSRSWANATFRHPAIRGGEHTYRSFACSRCHPNGYSSAACTGCHDSEGGEDDD